MLINKEKKQLKELNCRIRKTSELMKKKKTTSFLDYQKWTPSTKDERKKKKWMPQKSKETFWNKILQKKSKTLPQWVS